MPSKKKQMRKISKENGPPLERGGGKSSTVSVEWGKTDKGYEVNPTIFKNKDGSWSDLGKKGNEAYNEAKKRGQVIPFKRAKRAAKFAAGSWKQGEERKEAMTKWRKEGKKEFKKINKSL